MLVCVPFKNILTYRGQMWVGEFVQLSWRSTCGHASTVAVMISSITFKTSHGKKQATVRLKDLEKSLSSGPVGDVDQYPKMTLGGFKFKRV